MKKATPVWRSQGYVFQKQSGAPPKLSSCTLWFLLTVQSGRDTRIPLFSDGLPESFRHFNERIGLLCKLVHSVVHRKFTAFSTLNDASGQLFNLTQDRFNDQLSHRVNTT